MLASSKGKTKTEIEVEKIRDEESNNLDSGSSKLSYLPSSLTLSLYIIFLQTWLLYKITAGSHETKAPQDPLTPTNSSSTEEDASFHMQQISSSRHMTKTPTPPPVSTNIPSPPI